MLPQFPIMKKLELSDREDIEAIITKFPPYSDYNFVSMWSYDTDNLLEVAELYGNLILKFQDYIDLSLFYTFLGTNHASLTAKELLQVSQENGMKAGLKLIPHSSVAAIGEDPSLEITEDRDDFDYVIDAQKFSEMPGRTYHSRRKEIGKFTTLYGEQAEFAEVPTVDPSLQREMLALFEYWISAYDKTPEESAHEYKALTKLFSSADAFSLHTYTLRVAGKLVGFIVTECVHEAHAVLQFGKWDHGYRGAGEYLQHRTIRALKDLGALMINYEQDLGIPGLRQAKSLTYPDHFLKKYQITLR